MLPAAETRDITQPGDCTSLAPGKLNCQNFIIVPRRHWVNKSGGHRILLVGREGGEGETDGRRRNPVSKKELLQKVKFWRRFTTERATERDFWNVRRARVAPSSPKLTSNNSTLKKCRA